AEVPETYVVELGAELKAGDLLEEAVEVEVVRGGVRRYGRVEEPALADVDASEELPVALEVRVEHAIGGAFRKALEAFVKAAGTEDGEDHAAAEVCTAHLDAQAFADHRSGAVG